MKTTLINCGVRTSKSFDGARAPQGCLYLLAACEEAGRQVDFRDYQTANVADPLNAEVLTDYLDDGADVTAISCMSNLLPLVLTATERLKSRRPGKKVVLGGIGPSGVADRLMEAFPQVDVVAKGEGEESFVELLDALEGRRPIEGVAGLLVREGDSVRTTAPRARRKLLDSLPVPAYHRVDMQRYETVGIQTARGCPFPCKFCDVSVYWGRKTTYRSVDPVMREMRQLEDFGFDKVTILDDTFILNRRRVHEFCDAWTREGLGIRWSAYCRVDLCDEEIISALESNGCYRVFLGLESGSNRVLEQIDKPLDHAHLAWAVKRMQERMLVRCNLIWGFPFETLEDLRETVHMLYYLQELGCDVSLSLLSPLPLSTLYEEKKYPLVLREDLDLQSSVVSSRFFLKDGSRLIDGKPAELIRLIREHPDIFPGFYTFADPLFEQKLKYLRKMGLEIEKLERQ